jgi:predicted nuclease of restriction endonuclease-like (RecB) superfamily
MPTSVSKLPDDYAGFLEDLKERVRTAQLRASIAANSEMVMLYWSIGRDILDRQERAGWGTKVIDRLSADLRREFPRVRGFSARNLKYMRAFAKAWPDQQIVQQAAAQLPWFHNCVLLDKLKTAEERLAYAAAAREHGWSRDVLEIQIETGYLKRLGKSVNNFPRTLPKPQSDLAAQTLKDPYMFDFLELQGEVSERRLERALVEKLRSFLLELGVGFAFVGNQVHLEVEGEDFYLDMLFYHLRLRCYVIVELKATTFRPEYAGKLQFYLSAVDDLIRDPQKDGPTIGLLLCKSKKRVIVEYTLREGKRPIGVANYQLVRALPDELAKNLPTVDALEAQLSQKATGIGEQEDAKESATP